VQKLSKVLQSSAIAFLIILILSIVIQIIMRNIFNAGSIVLEELARFSLVSLVFLMVPALTIEKRQIVVDIVLMYLPRGARRVFDIIIHLLSSGFSVFILIAIALIMKKNWNVRTPAMRMPNAIFYLPVALGIFFNLIASLWLFVTTLTRKEGSK
jgi:TRAP-type C4-dicarboxylate transport system permease small subunit